MWLSIQAVAHRIRARPTSVADSSYTKYQTIHGLWLVDPLDKRSCLEIAYISISYKG